jgi:dimethylargininase
MTDHLIAITRPPTEALLHCELTHLEREPIDFQLAAAQHRGYEDALRALGAEVVSLPPEPRLPDAVFVEDTALVLDEIAVMMHPGASSRVPEVETVARALEPYRSLAHILPPGMIDGGDVLRTGRTIYVGVSSRTNREAVERLSTIAVPHGYHVKAVQVSNCLHLKSACTYVGDNTVLANRNWLPPDAFADLNIIDVAEDEPRAANTFFVGETLVMADNYPKTRAKLEAAGRVVCSVALTELQKAEAGGSCMSLVFAKRVISRQ